MEPPQQTRTELEALLRSLNSEGAARRLREIQAVREECASLSLEPQSLRAQLQELSHRFRSGRGEKWCGHASVSDYARERLGVASSTFHRWAKNGALAADTLANSKNSAGLDGTASSGALPNEASDADAATLANQSVAGESTEVPVRLRVDAHFAPYVRETFRLAGALIGNDVDDEARLCAILAEASSEIDVTVSAEDALRRLGWNRSTNSTVNKGRQRVSEQMCSSAAMRTDAKHRVLTREESHTLDLSLRRVIAKRRRMRVRHETRLLRFQQESTHAKLGYSRFDDFARRELGLSPSTVFEMLQRARRRRANDPIAVAYSSGRIGAVQAGMLHQIWRVGIPRGDLSSWIDLAARLTVRGLRDRISWARDRADTDYRSWSLSGCHPPSDEELRTTRLLLSELARDPNPLGLLASPRTPWKRHTSFRWILSEETAAFLAQLIASIQDHSLRSEHGHCESWRAFLIVCHHARRAWTQIERPRSRREEAVLDRDDWRCAVPGCSSRRSLQRHHIVFAGRGGGDESENLVTLCAFHHLIGVHQGILAIHGRATHGSEDLRFELGLRSDGRALASFRGEHRIRRLTTHNSAAGIRDNSNRYFRETTPAYGSRHRGSQREYYLQIPLNRPLPHSRSWAMLDTVIPTSGGAEKLCQRTKPCHSGTYSG